jgi:hypothetical protein
MERATPTARLVRMADERILPNPSPAAAELSGETAR